MTIDPSSATGNPDVYTGGTHHYGDGAIAYCPAGATVTYTSGSKELTIKGGDWSNWLIMGGGIMHDYAGSDNDAASNYSFSLSDMNVYEVNGGNTYKSGMNASGNKVYLTNVTAWDVAAPSRPICGGYVNDGEATNNTVSLTNSTVWKVYGGYSNGSATDLVTGNTLELSGANTVATSVQNFQTIKLKDVTWGTPVLTFISGAKGIRQNDDGSWADIDGSALKFTNPGAAHGSINLITAPNDIGCTVTGANLTQPYTNSPVVAGVTADGTMTGSIAISGKNVTYTTTSNVISKLTFTNVAWKDSGALIDSAGGYSFTNASVDTTNINFTNIKALKAGKTMTLVSNFGNNIGTITGTKYKVGSTLEGEGKASLVGNNLIFTAETGVGSLTAQEQTHNTVMGATASMTALSMGNDFIGAAADGLSLGSNTGADGVSTFAQMGGGSMRQETGSHVTSHLWNAILALGHQNEKKSGTTEYGAFFEYGTGNYTTFNGDIRGDGSMHYTGGGFLGKWTSPKKDYFEGSIRLGRINDDATNVLTDAAGNAYDYHTKANYYGFHVGYGKVFDYSGGRSLDVYGKFFYNHRNGVSFDAGGHYDLDAVNSQILRLGARYSMKTSDQWKWYSGLAYEYEFGGEATGTADGVAIRGASTKGGSLRAEVGATITQADSPWTVDLNLTAFAGKKRGLTGGVGLKYNF